MIEPVRPAAATTAQQGAPWRGWRAWGDASQSDRAPYLVDHVMKLSRGRVLAERPHDSTQLLRGDDAPVPPWLTAGRPAGINPERTSAWTLHSHSGDRRARRVFLLSALLLTTGSWAPARSTAEAEAQVIRVESRSRPSPPPPFPSAQLCAVARSAALRLVARHVHDARSAKLRRATTSAMAVVAAGFSIPAAQYESYAR